MYLSVSLIGKAKAYLQIV